MWARGGWLFVATGLALLLPLCETVRASPTSIIEGQIQLELAQLAAQIARRTNPNRLYEPSFGPCPPAQGNLGFIRDARNNTLSSNESDYIDRHLRGQQAAWRTWLSSSNPGPSLDGPGGISGGVANYTNTVGNLPRVGIALSGGGYRAMIHGSGYLQGLDSRNTTAQQRGTAGFLQMASYIAGLSGGSWAVGSMALNDWPTAQQLVTNVWNLNQDLIIPQDNAISYFASIITQVAGKRDAGFPTALTDYWGRALSYHLVNSSYPNQGEATTFSDIRNVSGFASASFPYPVVIAAQRRLGELLIYRNTTIWEFSPFDFGSWDPAVSAFIPIDLVGTRMTNGTSTQVNGNCTFGFENFGWTVGTSSTLFNGLYNQLITNEGSSAIRDAIASVLQAVSSENNDVSVLPNAFGGWFTSSINSTIGSLPNITLVDGGEDNQNVPINTLLQPARNLDFILAVDSSADATDWPNGTAIRETYLRYEGGPQYDYIAMPRIPSVNTIINRGLNTRPTFFGCNATTDVIHADTSANGTKAPIIAYVANYPWSSLSNTSTFQLQYTMDQTQQIIDNAVEVATLGGASNGSIYWPTCLACASLERSFERSNNPRPAACTACLNAYCWDGVTNETAPGVYSPPLGRPAWVTSQGSIQVKPASTGGDGSNVNQNGTSTSPTGSSNGAEAPVYALSISPLPLLALLFCSSVILTLL